MNNPVSTYRIQFHKDFNFDDFEKIIPYLIDLGVDTVYASPIFEAMPVSTHGYDVVNPLRINPEIGTESQLLAISERLKQAGIKWLQDIVPNHMAFHDANKWLMDVLEKGEQSDYAAFFDIDFRQADARLMVPFLGEDLEDAIDNKSIQLKEIEGKFFLATADSNWPVNLETAIKLSNENLAERNNQPGFIKEIANAQHYRLCNWQETNSRINYRRFFTVNSLICLNIQNPEVFATYHKYIFELVDKGVFQGLRIDHIDGLYDPKEYLGRLREAVGDDVYIVIEKILEAGESLPTDWKIQGTTGYDFLSMVNNLFTNKKSEQEFNNLYNDVIGKKLDAETLTREKKTAILWKHMLGELNNLCELFTSSKLIEAERFTAEELKLALAEFLIEMPVYRYYDYIFPLKGTELSKVEALINPVIENEKTKAIGEILYEVFIKNPPLADESYNERLGLFYKRCMQFTGPLMAKGVEDTLMFTYNRFVGHAEVGDAPDAFGLSVAEFHAEMEERQDKWHLSMNASSTHDTKKGEDVRARLNVLTDIPDRWINFVKTVQESVERLQVNHPSFKWLHKNDVYFILQNLVGALPFPGTGDDDIESRLQAFIEKALREAKKRSDWAEPDEAYEGDMKDFVLKLLNENKNGQNIIERFVADIADFAIINSLAQTLLKFTCPGIPDVYQGTELWDLSLVDPDNRRPVDYNLRIEQLQSIKTEKNLETSRNERFSGKIKLFLTSKLLRIRAAEKALFETGTYIPLATKGKYAGNIFAFAKQLKDNWVIVAAPLGIAKLADEQNVAAEKVEWYDTRIVLPNIAPQGWENLITGEEGFRDINQGGLLLSELFADLPVAVIKLLPKKYSRSAGVLMHITSLPSAFGIGDLGPGAKKFVDFLYHSNQRYWQILPLNPTKKENGHSPYSSNSAFAGNFLMISPQALINDGLLTERDCDEEHVEATDSVDFTIAEALKDRLLKKAFSNFKNIKNDVLDREFKSFCITEMGWLDNFAIYAALKKQHSGAEWYKCPEQYKRRETKMLSSFEEQFGLEIEEIKWQQFIFFRQWNKIKAYANEKNIQIIGDLPFYLDYDSVEVWSSPENFLLDEQLNKEQVAGVPPDYFNAKGQLWGMPIFNWELMKKDNFSWWMNRLKKNMELYDLLRLDHFRAFESYWQVPAGSEDAINGQWIKGPDVNFLQIAKDELGSLPFIAEDLGEISEEVEDLIRKFNLPGMKVLQFAFDEHLPESSHATHNFTSTNCIVYSGTHDNNTLKGWFKNETDAALHNRLSKYVGLSVTKENINEVVIRLCYSSIAWLAVLPLQDILGLDERARMNTPGTNQANWNWKIAESHLNENISERLSFNVAMFGR